MTRSRRTMLVVLALALLGVALALYFGRSAPDAVDLGRVIAGGTTEAAGGPVANSEDPQEVVTDATGVWFITTSAVEFDREAGSGTWVGYRIAEELVGRGAFTAIGRTPDVSGSVNVEGTEIVAADIQARLTTLQSDSGLRDGRVSPVFADRDAVFTLTGPVSFGSVPAPQERITLSAPGTLSIGEVKRPVVFELEATVLDGRLVISGTTSITLADFEVTVPGSSQVLSVADVATIELLLYLERG